MAVATIAEATLVGQQIRVILKLPAGVAQPDQGIFVSALSGDVRADIAAQARPTVNGDARIKSNLALLSAGTQIDLADPVVVVIPPTEDDVAILAFRDALNTSRLVKAHQVLDAALESQYQKASAAVKVRIDQMLVGF